MRGKGFGLTRKARSGTKKLKLTVKNNNKETSFNSLKSSLHTMLKGNCASYLFTILFMDKQQKQTSFFQSNPSKDFKTSRVHEEFENII